MMMPHTKAEPAYTDKGLPPAPEKPNYVGWLVLAGAWAATSASAISIIHWTKPIEPWACRAFVVVLAEAGLAFLAYSSVRIAVAMEALHES